jgi:two-component system chemotaxis response regulator CheY
MLTVAIIDDDMDTITILAKQLKSFNVKVIAVGYNGHDAVEIYKKYRPDVLFLDLQMPQHDGIYALKKIRSSDPQARIIITTPSPTKEESRQLDELGPTTVLYKPFDLSKITDLLDKIGIYRSYDKTKAALVSVTVEQTLLSISKSAVNEVGRRLYSRYGCYFSDCLVHPEYLKNILEEIFGGGADSIIKTIRESLVEFEDHKSISNFLSVLSS